MNRLLGLALQGVLGLMLVSCEDAGPIAVGQLASDRVEIVAEASEPIVAIGVSEGDTVDAGQALVRQDTARFEAREREVRGAIRELEALLSEQRAGPREETIEAAGAEVRAAQVDVDLRERELRRLESLLGDELTSRESVDQARARLDAARARLDSAGARLRELEAGTRPERMEQTRQRLEQADARLEQIVIDKRRLDLRAPVAGTVDSLPFEVGERPAAGSVIAVLLTGKQPHARVYVPEALRVHLQPGDAATVYVDGLDAPLSGTIRRIAAEATFTPYFSLTERDRGRLSFVAEITLPDREDRLPDGVPVEVEFPAAGGDDGSRR